MSEEQAKPNKTIRRTPKFRRRAEARPDEVLDAALALFMENGFAATRVEDIAKRAGISKGSVYLYFPSKEALMEGLVRRAIVPITENATQMMAHFTGNPRIAITAILTLLGMKISDPKISAVPRLIMREAIQFPELALIYRREVLDKVIPIMTGVIERGIADGYFRPADPDLTIRSIIGPIMLHLLMDEVFDLRPTSGLALDRLVENHLKILFDGLSAPETGDQK